MTRRRALYVVGAILGAVILVNVAVPEILGIGPELRAYPGRLAAAKRLGVEPSYARMVARDAAKPAAARAAFAELDGIVRDAARFDLPRPKKGGALPSTGPAPTRKRTLAEFREDLRRIGALSRSAEGGSRMDWAMGWELLLPQFANVKASATGADGLACADAADGRFSSATGCVVDAADVWRAYGDLPLVIADLVRTSGATILFRTSGRLLAHPDYPAAEARRLGAMAEGPDLAAGPPIRELLATETTVMHEMLEDPDVLRRAMGEGFGGRELDMTMRVAGARRMWQSDALRLMNAAVPRLPADPYDFDGAKRVAADYDRGVTTPRGWPGRFLDATGMVSYAPLVESRRRREATRRVLIVAAALRSGEGEAALRRRLGRFARDPYDGKPIRIRPMVETPYWLKEGPATGGAALSIAPRATAVYSIGENRKDDGGRTTTKSDQGDLVLIVPR